MRSVQLAALFLSSAGAVFAQHVISAHSGVLHYSEGSVLIDGKAIDQKFGTFPEIKENSVLSTERGRAEILLTPGVFLRVGENSSIRMITNRLIDTRVEFLGGEIIVESDDPMKENAVTIAYGDFQVHVRKAGVMQFESEPAQLKVFHGEAQVELSGVVMTVRAGKMMPFGPAMVTEKFDIKTTDELARWSMRRSGDVAVANISAAKSLRDSGSSWTNNGWYYNPYYSMFTYIPGSGSYFNSYGYGFWSPRTVYNVYAYAGNYGGNSGRNGSVRTGDQSGNFGRNSNSGFATNTNSAANTGFGRNSGNFSTGSVSSGPAVSTGGTFSPASGGGASGGHSGHR